MSNFTNQMKMCTFVNCDDLTSHIGCSIMQSKLTQLANS